MTQIDEASKEFRTISRDELERAIKTVPDWQWIVDHKTSSVKALATLGITVAQS